ncbi:TSUP family transporter [Vulcanisaeta distributa]|uniref:TSUP family transporter n=1 Tax=Vulcanisaeta distributa TaxID=164451 RepID=UPI000A8D381A|nr:TSUP family transporter [Vulcanisaeta distributa]
MPIQSYILGTTNPVITSTNLMYNLVSIPLSIYKYVREKRIAASFTLVLVIGSSISAALGGAWLRGHYLTSKYVFSYFMGTLLLVLAVELVLSSLLIKEVHTYEAVIRCNRNKSSLIITTTGGAVRTGLESRYW